MSDVRPQVRNTVRRQITVGTHWKASSHPQTESADFRCAESELHAYWPDVINGILTSPYCHSFEAREVCWREADLRGCCNSSCQLSPSKSKKGDIVLFFFFTVYIGHLPAASVAFSSFFNSFYFAGQNLQRNFSQYFIVAAWLWNSSARHSLHSSLCFTFWNVQLSSLVFFKYFKTVGDLDLLSVLHHSSVANDHIK